MTVQTRRGFTLVELLMVMLIVGLLAALLFPAISAARDSGRKVACLNRMRELGVSLQSYETDNTKYPGWRHWYRRNRTDGSVGFSSWLSQLLPYMQRRDIYDAWLNGSTTALDTPLNGKLVCPADVTKLKSSQTFTSYVANTGRRDRLDLATGQIPSDWRSNAMLLSQTDSRGTTDIKVVYQTSGFIQKGDGMENTLMLSENLDGWLWPAAAINVEPALGFVFWPPNRQGRPPSDSHFINGKKANPNIPFDYDVARPSSNHIGGVNVIFASGSGQFLAEDIEYRTFVSLMTPKQSTALEPGTTDPSPTVRSLPKLTTGSY